MYPKRKKTTKKATQRKSALKYPRARISGRGAYTVHDGPQAAKGAALGSMAGMMYGGPIGSYVGELVGRRAFHYGSKLLGGSGDYYESNQPLVSTGSHNRISPPKPTFTVDKDGVCISHTEYLGDIITSSNAGALKIQKFDINPSDPSTFPWLSSIASQSFQQYKFSGCMFQFKSYSANALNSTNTALGAVFSAVNYDFNDDDFTTRAQIENTSWSQSCKPSDDVMIPVECKPSITSMNGFLYVQNGFGLPPGSDPRLFNLGKLFIGTTGFQGQSVNIGSLYVSYKIHLFKPIIPAPLSVAHFVNRVRSGVTNANPLGTAFTVNANACDTLGMAINAAGTVMQFNQQRLIPGQRFLLSLIWYGVGVAWTAPTVTVFGFEQLGGFNSWTSTTAIVPRNGATSDICEYSTELVVDNTNVSRVVNVSTTGVLPTGGTCQVYITQRNGQDSLLLGFAPTS